MHANGRERGARYHLIPEAPDILVLPASPAAPGAPVSPEPDRVWQERLLPPALRDDREPLAARGVPPCLQEKSRMKTMWTLR